MFLLTPYCTIPLTLIKTLTQYTRFYKKIKNFLVPHAIHFEFIFFHLSIHVSILRDTYDKYWVLSVFNK